MGKAHSATRKLNSVIVRQTDLQYNTPTRFIASVGFADVSARCKSDNFRLVRYANQ